MLTAKVVSINFLEILKLLLEAYSTHNVYCGCKKAFCVIIKTISHKDFQFPGFKKNLENQEKSCPTSGSQKKNLKF